MKFWVRVIKILSEIYENCEENLRKFESLRKIYEKFVKILSEIYGNFKKMLWKCWAKFIKILSKKVFLIKI